MSTAELEKILEAIRSGRINKCLGCLAWEIAVTYMYFCDAVFEQAMLELLEHESPEAQYPAYLVLCQCQDKLSEAAIQKINKYKKNACHKRVLRQAQKKYGISPEAILKK